MAIIFENLLISRVTIHEIFQVEETGKKINPIYGETLIKLDSESMDALRDRVSAAMGSASKSVQMEIIQCDENSLIKRAIDLANGDDKNFVSQSKFVADKLVQAQNRRGLPGGILISFDGSVGHPKRRIVGFIKAETHTGFIKDVAPKGELILKYLKSLILTPEARLYKIGVFSEEVADAKIVEQGWAAYVYDDLISGGNRGSAAIYFYDKFLGCGFPASSAKLTKEFYDLTRKFINGLSIDDGEKFNLHNALVSYLRDYQSQTIQVSEFSKSYIQKSSDRDLYGEYMKDGEFPAIAVTKDLTDLMGVFRRRIINFSNSIKLSAPADKFKEYVVVEPAEGADENGKIQQWTKIIIKDKMRNQE